MTTTVNKATPPKIFEISIIDLALQRDSTQGHEAQ